MFKRTLFASFIERQTKLAFERLIIIIIIILLMMMTTAMMTKRIMMMVVDSYYSHIVYIIKLNFTKSYDQKQNKTNTITHTKVCDTFRHYFSAFLNMASYVLN